MNLLTRRPILVPVAVLLGLVATACGASQAAVTVDVDDPAAVVVGDDSVSRGDLLDDLPVWSAFRQLPPDSAELTADLLTIYVQVRVLEAAVGLAGSSIDGEAEAQGRSDYEAFLTQLDAQVPGLEFTEHLESELQRLFTAQAALEAAIAAEADVSDEAFAAFGESTVCSRHVLVETEDEADEVLARLDAGEAFVEVAVEASVDPSAATNGGDLGCNPLGSFVPEFEEAAVAADPGEIVGPVESEFGFHVIQRYADDEARSAFEGQAQAAAQEQAIAGAQQVAGEAVTLAEVDIDPRYGTWDPELLSVVPPEGPVAPVAPLPVG